MKIQQFIYSPQFKAKNIAILDDSKRNNSNNIKENTNKVTSDPFVISKAGADAIKNIVLVNDLLSSKPEIQNYDVSLFKDTTLKPQFSLDNPITPESLVMVHRTDYFPHNGIIITQHHSSKDANGICSPRDTTHFSLNKSVTEHSWGANWDQMKYALILPFKETIESIPKEKVIGGITEDFFIQSDVKLPEGSVILTYSKDVPWGKLRVSQAEDNGKTLKGVKLVETSNSDMNKVVSVVLRKMGYASMDNVNKNAKISNTDAYNMSTFINPDLIDDEFNLYNIHHNKNTDSYVKKIHNIWNDFCEDNNYIQGLHTYSPWGRSDMVIHSIQMLFGTTNSWKGSDASGHPIDYQKELCKVLDECKEDLPEGKHLSFDAEKVKAIIKSSKNPQIALDKMADKLKLKPLNLVGNPTITAGCLDYSDGELFNYIDERTCLSEEYKDWGKRRYKK